MIIGAETGGMPAAYEMKEAVGKQHEVTVINTSEYFQFVPSNPWLAVDWRQREQISFPIAEYLQKKDIKFIASAVEKINSHENSLELANGSSVSYDRRSGRVRAKG